MFIILALVSAWIPPSCSITQGHHSFCRSWNEIVFSVFGSSHFTFTIQSGSSPSTISTVLALSKTSRWHTPSSRAAWRKQALSRGRGKALLGVPKLIDCLVLDLLLARHLWGGLILSGLCSRVWILCLTNIQNTFTLSRLSLILNYCFSERCLTIQRI